MVWFHQFLSAPALLCPRLAFHSRAIDRVCKTEPCRLTCDGDGHEACRALLVGFLSIIDDTGLGHVAVSHATSRSATGRAGKVKSQAKLSMAPRRSCLSRCTCVYALGADARRCASREFAPWPAGASCGPCTYGEICVMQM